MAAFTVRKGKLYLHGFGRSRYWDRKRVGALLFTEEEARMFVENRNRWSELANSPERVRVSRSRS